MIIDRAVVQSFLYMNWFSMFFQIDFFRRIKVKTLVCFLTSFLHENNWHVLQNVFSIKTKITNWAIIYLIFWINKFKVFSHFSFLRITMITDRAVVQYFLYMNWFSMLFGIEFFGRIIFTTCACFLTSCPHENNWHVFQNHKISILEKKKSQIEHLCDFSCEWTDSRCVYNSLTVFPCIVSSLEQFPPLNSFPPFYQCSVH